MLNATISIELPETFSIPLPVLGFNQIPLWAIFILAFGGASLVAIFVRVVIVPWQRAKITGIYICCIFIV